MKKERLKGEPFDWQDLLYRNGDPDFPDLSPAEREMVNKFKARINARFERGLKIKPTIIVVSGTFDNSYYDTDEYDRIKNKLGSAMDFLTTRVISTTSTPIKLKNDAQGDQEV